MRHHDRGVAHAGFQLCDQVGDQLRVGGIEPGRRLVEKHDLRLADEGPGDPDALAHPAGELGRQELERFLTESDQREEMQHPFANLRLGQIRVLAKWIRDVLVGRERVEQGRALEDEPHPPAQRQQLLFGELLDVHAEHAHLSLVRTQESRDVTEEHGLAGAAAAHHDQRLGPFR